MQESSVSKKPRLTGIDIVSIPRIKAAALNRRFLERVFTEDEIRYSFLRKPPYKHLAGSFAAKESCAKALATGIGRGVKWRDIEVINDKDGVPSLRLHAGAEGFLSGRSIFLSISYSKNLAIAFVVVE